MLAASDTATLANVGRLEFRTRAMATVPAGPIQRQPLASLADLARHVTFARGETIFHEGDPAERVYEVRSGIVRLCKTLSDGRRQVLDFVESGRFVALHDDDVHSVTAEAVTGVSLASYPRASVEAATASDTATACRFVAELRSEMTRTEARLVLVGRKTAEERVASFLLARARRDLCDGDSITLPMTRLDIADYLAMTIETVSRVIGKLKAQGMIALAGAQTIVFHDVEMLRELAEA